jgi:hypothetical protein
MRLRASLAVLIVLQLPGAAFAAEPGWLPPEAEEGIAKQLAERLAEIATGPATEAGALLERARKDVGRQRARLESWGSKGVLDRAPDLAKLEMPKTDDKRLDAMSRYQMCNAILYIRHQARGAEKDAAARLTAARGLTGITLAVLYVGSPILAADGTDERVKAFLTSDAQEVVMNRVQDQPGLLEYADRQCLPVVKALIAD